MLARYVGFVERTSRVVFEPADARARYVADAPQIVAMWHGQFLMVPALAPRDGTVTHTMVARHGDGELIGDVLRAFDFPMIRGAGAGGRRRDRGGAAALRAAVRVLAEGNNVAMTADIPPGPARIAGPGIVTLARLSGAPIRPIAVASSRYRAFDTWSRMTLNLPFSRIAFVVGEPIKVPREADEAGLEIARRAVEDELNRVTARAYALAGADFASATPPNALPAGAPPAKLGARLGSYRLQSRTGAALAPLILRRRQKRGKEDPERISERLGNASRSRPEGPLLWCHAASVGETNAALPVLRDIAARRPDIRLLLTTGTRTSAAIAGERLADIAIHQFVPVDTPGAMQRFLDHWKPDLAVLTESEIWPNLVVETHARGVPMVLINARISQKSFKRWRKARGMAAALFSRFAAVLAQNERLARQFVLLGARNVTSVGNLKIDAPALPADTANLAQLRAQIGARPCVLAASTHDGEDIAVIEAHLALKQRHPELLTIIAPRHPHRGPEIRELCSAHGLGVAVRSEAAAITSATDIYLADTIGELGLFYRLAPVAFIGGSLIPHGGQNPIEAVRLGAAVVTGPNRSNFQDSYEALLSEGGAIEIAAADELAGAVGGLLASDVDLRRQIQAAEVALAELGGAQARTVDTLLAYFRPQEQLQRAS